VSRDPALDRAHALLDGHGVATGGIDTRIATVLAAVRDDVSTHEEVMRALDDARVTPGPIMDRLDELVDLVPRSEMLARVEALLREAGEHAGPAGMPADVRVAWMVSRVS
jgi:hypothetical protein